MKLIVAWATSAFLNLFSDLITIVSHFIIFVFLLKEKLWIIGSLCCSLFTAAVEKRSHRLFDYGISIPHRISSLSIGHDTESSVYSSGVNHCINAS